MTGKWARLATSAVLLVLVGLSSLACQPSADTSDKQTNWLRGCEIDAQCTRGMTCQCGACTQICDTQTSCQGLPGSSCVPPGNKGSIALCGGEKSTGAGLCLPSCVDAPCADGQMCVAGVCAPLPTPTAHVSIDPSVHHQVLTGLGATVGYAEDAITSHPKKAALYGEMFASLGLDVLRFRDRYGYPGGDSLLSAAEITREATTSLSRKPTILLGSWSPPGVLKANGTVYCQSNFDTCTLAQAAGGGFDYAGYATYWRGTLDAYAAQGITPDYIGIQNNPDFVPSSTGIFEACKFLPKEGTQTVTVNGAQVPVRYPGYDEALSAVLAQLDGLKSPPKIVAPEVTAANLVAGYVSGLDMSKVDAIGHHLYGTDPTALDPSSLQTLGSLGQQYDLPLFQTEMQADGFGTALLLHDALVVEGASVYIQSALIGPAATPGIDPTALITLGATEYTLEAPYYAMRQYAFYTDPGWVRVDAVSSSADLLTSAWVSPEGDKVTLVMTNQGRSTVAAQLDLGAVSFGTSLIVRTAFDGIERTAELGSLPSEGILQIPAHSVVTVVLSP
ncbi:MAG: glycoside hydrolase family 30 beta sandwich domain-containing protein [Polyangiaceae bacterium]